MTERNADVSKTLTEQWKKGELPSGWYWCKCYDEETKLLYYDGDCFELDDPETKNYYFFLKKDCEEIVILEEVPTFEELQASENYNKHLEEKIKIYERKDKQATETSIAYEKLLEENAQLKELLKECKHIMSIEKDFASCHFEKDKLCKLLAKINQALGEE